MTPLAAAALFRNAVGVEAVLQTPGADFYTDLVAPSIPATLRAKDAETAAVLAKTTALQPLHAAMIGRRYEVLRAPIFREPNFNRDYLAYKEKCFYESEGAKMVRKRDRLSGEPPADDAETTPVVQDTARPRVQKSNVTARKAYLDDCVTTVQLLTADAAVCAATINATHPHDGLHYTPLQLGARLDRLPMPRVLLDRGADPSIPVPHTGRSVFFSVFASLLRLCSNTGRCDLDGGGMNPPPYRPEVDAIDASIGTAGMTSLVCDLLWSGPKINPEAEAETEEAEAEMEVARCLARVNEADADGNTPYNGLWDTTYRTHRRRCSRSARVPTPVTTPARFRRKADRRRRRGGISTRELE